MKRQLKKMLTAAYIHGLLPKFVVIWGFRFFTLREE